MLTVLIILLVLLVLDLLFTVMLMGRRKNPRWDALRGYLYAHRGYHDKPQIPENSLAAFRRAVEHGWGAELDVHLLKDGTLAVIHDSDPERVAGVTGIVEDMTKEDLNRLRLEGTDEHVPLFDEVLDVFENRTPLIIELKSYNGNHLALTEAVCRRLDSYNGDFCLESFDPFVVRDLRKLRPAWVRGQLSRDFRKDSFGLGKLKVFAARNLVFNFLTLPDFIAYKFEDRKNYCLRSCLRTWGVQQVSWTIRSQEDLDTCLREGSIPIFEKFEPAQDTGETAE